MRNGVQGRVGPGGRGKGEKGRVGKVGGIDPTTPLGWLAERGRVAEWGWVWGGAVCWNFCTAQKGVCMCGHTLNCIRTHSELHKMEKSWVWSGWLGGGGG